MKVSSRRVKQVPRFRSEDEERDFWAEHDSTEHVKLVQHIAPSGRGRQAFPPIGRGRIRWCDSSTMITAPFSRASIESASTAARCSITWDVRVLWSLKRMTLAFRPLEKATISPKSRSKVKITRSSAMAFAKISPLDIRCNPSSWRWVASCPWRRGHCTTRTSTPISARNRTASLPLWEMHLLLS